MKPIFRTFIILCIVTGLSAVLTLVGCEHFQAVTYVNRTSTPVKVHLADVPLDYSENITRTWDDPGDLIEPGESKRLLTQVFPERSGGIMSKYIIIAVNERDEIILNKTYTWDELHDMDWTVVIVGSDSNNITMGNILGGFQYRLLQCRM